MSVLQIRDPITNEFVPIAALQGELYDGSVTEEKLADASVTKEKLADTLVDEILFNEDIEIFTVATPIRAYCTAIIDSNGRCILLDLSSTTITITPTASMTSATDLVCDASAPYVIEALEDKITNVDAVVLSHYHYDHIGNLETLFGENGLPCENTKFFLPKIANVIAGSKGVSQAMHDDMVAYNNWLTQHGFSKEVPEEGQEEVINGIKLTFHNCDADYWEDKASTTDYEYEYNDTSICTLVEYGEGRFYSVGDAYWDLQKWLVDNEYVEKADILLAPHHGLTVNLYPEFIASVSPDVVIGQFGNAELLSEFVSNKYPSIPSTEKTEVANQLNMYIPYRTYFSAVANWCEAAGVPYVDTIDNALFSMKLCQSGAVMWEGVEPFVADGIVKTYASPRDALMHKEFISDSQTGVWDLLKNMPANSQIICYMTNGFQFIKDLKLPFYESSTTRNYLVAISKFVGASRNHSENDPAFYFTIDVTYYQGGNCDDRFVFAGKCNSSGVLSADLQKYIPFNLIYMSGTADASTHIYNMSANSGRSFESSLFTLNGTTFNVKKTGLYRVTMTGPNVNDTVVLESTSGSVKTTHILTGGATNTQIGILSTSDTYRIKSTTTINSLTVWIEWMGLTAGAEFPTS